MLEKFATISNTITIILFVVMAIIVISVLSKRFHTPDTTMKRTFGKAVGIIFGKDRFGRMVYSPAGEEGHVAVMGGSGSGKTSAVLIPSLRSWPGSVFSVDISGDISNAVNCRNQLVFAPGDPASPIAYDVFGLIDYYDDPDDRTEALQQLAFLLIPDDENTSSDGAYFTEGGRKILTASLLAFYERGDDFVDVCKLISESGCEELFRDIASCNVSAASSYISGFRGGNPKNIAGCYEVAQKSVLFFATSTKVTNNFHRPYDLYFDSPPQTVINARSIEDNSIFLMIPDAKLDVYRPILSIISAQILLYLSDRPGRNKKNILLALDEFASLGNLQIKPALQKLRKRKVRIMLCFQSLADIDSIYGHEAYRSILENIRFQVILSITEPDTQEYIARKIGKTAKKQSSYSASSLLGIPSTTTSFQDEYTIPPADLGYLKNDLILVSPDGILKLRKAFWFNHPKRL